MAASGTTSTLRARPPRNARRSMVVRWGPLICQEARADTGPGQERTRSRTRFAGSDVRVTRVPGLEIRPGFNVALFELAQELPARCFQDLVGQERVPGDAQPEGEVLGQGQRLRQLALH